MSNLTVSIIIPTKNSEETIADCLKTISQQSYKKIETIIVDCCSKDKTKEIAENFTTNIIQTKAKRSEARNKGTLKANGEFILFIDSDMQLTPNVVSDCIDKINQGYDAIIIPEVSFGRGYLAKCKALEKMCYIGDNSIEAPRFFRYNVFCKLGGYDTSLEAGEDWDIKERTLLEGYRIGRVKSIIQHNEGKLNIIMTMRKKFYYGLTINLYKSKHRQVTNQQIGLLRVAILKNKQVLKNPIHAIGLIILKTCELAALLSGHLFANLGKKTSFNSINQADELLLPENLICESFTQSQKNLEST